MEWASSGRTYTMRVISWKDVPSCPKPRDIFDSVVVGLKFFFCCDFFDLENEGNEREWKQLRWGGRAVGGLR